MYTFRCKYWKLHFKVIKESSCSIKDCIYLQVSDVWCWSSERAASPLSSWQRLTLLTTPRKSKNGTKLKRVCGIGTFFWLIGWQTYTHPRVIQRDYDLNHTELEVLMKCKQVSYEVFTPVQSSWRRKLERAKQFLWQVVNMFVLNKS